MITLWTSHLTDPEEQQRFKQTVLGSKSVLNRLKEILEARIKAIDSIETNPIIYDSASWAAKQAHYNGSKAELRAVIKAITLDQEHQ